MTLAEFEKLLEPGCQLEHHPPFGHCVTDKRLRKADVVIICLNEGGGLKTYELCLIHQVYAERLIELCEGKNVQQILLIPAKSKNYVPVTKWGHK